MSQSFSHYVCTCHEKTSLPSSLATILELQEIYSNQDTTTRVIAKLTSLEDVYFHREEKEEETRWNFVGGWRGILRLMLRKANSLFVSRIVRESTFLRTFLALLGGHFMVEDHLDHVFVTLIVCV